MRLRFFQDIKGSPQFPRGTSTFHRHFWNGRTNNRIAFQFFDSLICSWTLLIVSCLNTRMTQNHINTLLFVISVSEVTLWCLFRKTAQLLTGWRQLVSWGRQRFLCLLHNCDRRGSEVKLRFGLAWILVIATFSLFAFAVPRPGLKRSHIPTQCISSTLRQGQSGCKVNLIAHLPTVPMSRIPSTLPLLPLHVVMACASVNGIVYLETVCSMVSLIYRPHYCIFKGSECTDFTKAFWDFCGWHTLNLSVF